MFLPKSHPRKIKRSLYQEAMEWDEEDKGQKDEGLTPGLDWDMLNNLQGGAGVVYRVACPPTTLPCTSHRGPGMLGKGPNVEPVDEVIQVPVASDVAAKLGYPEVEKNLAPSACLGPAMKTLQKLIKRLEAIIVTFPQPVAGQAQKPSEAKLPAGCLAVAQAHFHGLRQCVWE